MSAAIDAKGLKRVCVNCGIRFYDFNKRPIECPNCDTEYTGEIKVKGRRGKAAVAAEMEKEKLLLEKKKSKGARGDNLEEMEQEDGVVSLEDLEEDAEDLDDDEADLAIDIDPLDDEEEEIEVEVEDDDKE